MEETSSNIIDQNLLIHYNILHIYLSSFIELIRVFKNRLFNSFPTN